jgi:hypothetical protein
MELNLQNLLSTVDNAKPFLKEKTRSIFIGRKISIPFKFFSSEDEQSAYRVNGVIETTSLISIVKFLVQVGDYPELESTDEGDRFIVSGTIESINQQHINLYEITNIEFLGKSILKNLTEPIISAQVPTNRGINTEGSLKEGEDIIVNGDKSTSHQRIEQKESNLDKFLWKFIVPIIVIVVAAGIVFLFDWS